jgi:hypothetical protein
MACNSFIQENALGVVISHGSNNFVAVLKLVVSPTNLENWRLAIFSIYVAGPVIVVSISFPPFDSRRVFL